MKNHIFFSYKREDEQFVLRLAYDIEKAGFSVWVDQIDIPPGAPWNDSIQKGLENSCALILILSPGSVNSQQVKDEVTYAQSNSIPIIPINYKDVVLPYYWARMQFIVLNETNYQASIGKVFKSLVDLKDCHKISSINLPEDKKDSLNTLKQNNKNPYPVKEKVDFAGYVIVALFLVTVYLINQKNTKDSLNVNIVKKKTDSEKNITFTKNGEPYKQNNKKIIDDNKTSDTKHISAQKIEQKLVYDENEIEEIVKKRETKKEIVNKKKTSKKRVQVKTPKKQKLHIEREQKKIPKETVTKLNEKKTKPLIPAKPKIDCRGVYQKQCQRLNDNDTAVLVVEVHSMQKDIVGNSQKKANEIVNYLKSKGFHRSRFVTTIYKDGQNLTEFSYRTKR